MIENFKYKTIRTVLIPPLFLTSFILLAQTETENIELSSDLDRIEVRGENKNKALISSGFKVDVLLTEEFKNSNYNLIEILESSPGISVRQNGGLGSNFQLSLNGLSGNQIRYFFDGIPMEKFGSGLNSSANLIEAMHIYKGVVPVYLGADALGGAINIVTPSLDEDSLDLSYTFGSFNTHKAAVFAHKHFDNDTFLRLSTNLEHSDNNYQMNEVVATDEIGNVIGTNSAERFHDQYTGGSVKIKAGVIDNFFADEFSVTATYDKNRNNHQHPSTSINKVFGKYHSNNKTQLLSTTYRKSLGNFDITAYALTGEVEDVTNDSYSREYEWSGEYTDKIDDVKGELGNKSIFTLIDKVTRTSLVGRYKLSETEDVTLSYSNNYVKRRGSDSLDASNTNFSKANWIEKSILGIAYDNREFLPNVDLSLFAKKYFYDGEINSTEDINDTNVNVKTIVEFNKTGGGTALSYLVTPQLRMKFSYEKAYRLPEAVEILGTGRFVLPNSSLQAEESHNFNAGILAEFNTDNSLSRLESNVFYRDSTNFIRYVPILIIYGEYQNLQNVETKGIEASYYLSLFDQYTIQFNATYQDIINKSQYDVSGVVDDNFNNRMPNEPYLFADLRLSVDFDIFDKTMKASWNSSFVEKFFLYWEGKGDPDSKFYIPQKITHDIDIEYTVEGGDYNVSLSIRNIFDASVYDNFNIQKPSRAAYLKFRYSF